MKTEKINKSAVMKRAWNIYRGKYHYSNSFGECLRRAWQVEKDNIVYRAKQAEEKAWQDYIASCPKIKSTYVIPSDSTFMESLYSNRAYSGD